MNCPENVLFSLSCLHCFSYPSVIQPEEVPLLLYPTYTLVNFHTVALSNRVPVSRFKNTTWFYRSAPLLQSRGGYSPAYAHLPGQTGGNNRSQCVKRLAVIPRGWNSSSVKTGSCGRTLLSHLHSPLSVFLFTAFHVF